MHINNSLSKLSKLELVNTTFQVLAVLEAAAANGFIPHEDTLLTQLRNFTKTFVGYDRRENSLTVCDIVPIEDSALPIGFYFEESVRQLNDVQKCRCKFWFTTEELLLVLQNSLANWAGLSIRGFLMVDSKKSLSPVRKISALAARSARIIGRSAVSRIRSSKEFLSSGTGTISKSLMTAAKNRSNAGSFSGNFLLKIRNSSSTFCSEITAVFGGVTAFAYAWNTTPVELRAAEINTL
ncbi:hypothetical protein, partial [Turicimonas muris]|uniref:hypothetical protein n=6 Tax=Turicimonas muris TaxID=1796652 RepID=UPI00263B4214